MDSPRIGLSRAKIHKISLLWLWIFLPHDKFCVERLAHGRKAQLRGDFHVVEANQPNYGIFAPRSATPKMKYNFLV